MNACPVLMTCTERSVFESSVVGFDGVVRVLLGDMACDRQQLVDHSAVGRCPVGAHLARVRAVLQGAGEELVSGRKISLLRDQDVDDLAVLVNRPVQIHPPPGDFHIRLVDAPAIAGCMPAGACRVDQQRGEPLHPAIDGHVVNRDAPFG
jgi:hypothetical protein